MTKKNGNKLMAVVLAGMLALVGCSSESSNTGTGSNTPPDSKNTYTIGISQLADHPALDDARKGFEDGLKELGVNAEIVYQNAQGDIPNTVTIAQKFVNDEVDLIYAIATPAAQSARQATDEIPVLFSAVTDPVQSEIVEDWESVGANVTGTSDKAPVEAQLKMFKQIDPSIKTIGVIYNTSEANSEIQLEEVKALAPAEGLEVVAVGVTTVSEMPQALDSLLADVDALYALSDNLVASSVELVTQKLIENNMISICAEESQVGGGLLLTNGLSYYELGKQTAQMAKEILVDGKTPAEIPVGLAEKTVTTVNKNTLEALGLDEGLDILKDAVKVGE